MKILYGKFIINVFIVVKYGKKRLKLQDRINFYILCLRLFLLIMNNSMFLLSRTLLKLCQILWRIPRNFCKTWMWTVSVPSSTEMWWEHSFRHSSSKSILNLLSNIPLCRRKPSRHSSCPWQSCISSLFWWFQNIEISWNLPSQCEHPVQCLRWGIVGDHIIREVHKVSCSIPLYREKWCIQVISYRDS